MKKLDGIILVLLLKDFIHRTVRALRHTTLFGPPFTKTLHLATLCDRRELGKRNGWAESPALFLLVLSLNLLLLQQELLLKLSWKWLWTEEENASTSSFHSTFSWNLPCLWHLQIPRVYPYVLCRCILESARVACPESLLEFQDQAGSLRYINYA